MRTPNPFPLFPTLDMLRDMSLQDYPALNQQLSAFDWHIEHWSCGAELLLYIGRNKSLHTYTSYRNAIEKFLLWLLLVHDKPFDVLDHDDILRFIDFCVKPPKGWVVGALHDRFILRDGVYQINPLWRPFRVRQNKADKDQQASIDSYRPSVETLNTLFAALSAFYTHHISKKRCSNNPVSVAKRDCKHLIKDVVSKPLKRLTAKQWSYVLSAAENMAHADAFHERTLFIIATIKTCFLRVSELSERDDWLPLMGHFQFSESDNAWQLIVFGKGRKTRPVTAPDDYIDNYLVRYRRWRGLSDLPSENEKTVLLEKIRGSGGLTARHITRLVQQVFDHAYESMRQDVGPREAAKLKTASVHYLRHTAASMEVERGRNMKQLSEELGHASQETTEKIYVKTEDRLRIAGGKDRKVR